MTYAPKISVIIPFLEGTRGFSSLRAVLESCIEQSLRAEIIVVTNRPSAELLRLTNKMDVEYLCSNSLGVNRARNLGAKKALGSLFYFLDDDCILSSPTHLERLLAIFTRHPEFSAFGGPYLSEPSAGWRARGYNAMATAWVQSSAMAQVYEIEMVLNLLGGNVCVRRESFGAGFDETIISGGDETEYFHRFRKAGNKLGFCFDLGVKHRADESFSGLLNRAKNQGRARSQQKSQNQLSLPNKVHGIKTMAKLDPAAIPFSMIHFPALWLHQVTSPQSSPSA